MSSDRPIYSNSRNGNGNFAVNKVKGSFTEKNLFTRTNKNFEILGFQKASEFMGDLSMYQLSLNKIIEEAKDNAKKDSLTNEKKKQPLRNKLNTQISEKELQELNLAELEGEKIPATKEEIKQLNDNIQKIKNNQIDVKHSNHLEFSKPRFYFEVFGLVFLTIFLYMFYMNVIYSAFLKNVGASLESMNNSSNLTILFNTIFDAGTFAAITKNLFTFIFISVSPAVPLAFGLTVINSFKLRKFWKAFSLIAVIFIFDALLAYVIVEKIYEAKYLIGLVENPWHFSSIFGLPEFYLTLISGFGVYLLWGLFLEIVLGEWERMQPSKFAIRENMKKINGLEEKLESSKNEASAIRKKIFELDKNISDLRYEIDNYFYIELSTLKQDIYAFTQGWAKFISGAFEEPEAKLRELSQITEEIIQTLGEPSE